jgi:hypothetical protein
MHVSQYAAGGLTRRCSTGRPIEGMPSPLASPSPPSVLADYPDLAAKAAQSGGTNVAPPSDKSSAVPPANSLAAPKVAGQTGAPGATKPPKQPHELPFNVFVGQQRKAGNKNLNLGETHRKAVEQAVKEGKSVPADVLEGYPHLKGQGGSSTSPAPAPKADKNAPLAEYTQMDDRVRQYHLKPSHGRCAEALVRSGYKRVGEEQIYTPAAVDETWRPMKAVVTVTCTTSAIDGHVKGHDAERKTRHGGDPGGESGIPSGKTRSERAKEDSGPTSGIASNMGDARKCIRNHLAIAEAFSAKSASPWKARSLPASGVARPLGR